jgi:TonB family protein
LRSGIRDKKVRAALIGSFFLHVLILTFLILHNQAVRPLKTGTISIDLIETARHENEASAPPRGAGEKPRFRDPRRESQTASPQTTDAKNRSPEIQNYILAVLKEINKRKVYPIEALDRGEEGRVVVGVSVGSDGQVLDVRVEEPSLSVRLNQAAVNSVKGVQSMPPVPSSISTPVHLHVPLVYRIENH